MFLLKGNCSELSIGHAQVNDNKANANGGGFLPEASFLHRNYTYKYVSEFCRTVSRSCILRESL